MNAQDESWPLNHYSFKQKASAQHLLSRCRGCIAMAPSNGFVCEQHMCWDGTKRHAASSTCLPSPRPVS